MCIRDSRKRSQKEKESLYTDIRSETVEKFLPVYDNLERALAQETQDAAFKKGVEMCIRDRKVASPMVKDQVLLVSFLSARLTVPVTVTLPSA